MEQLKMKRKALRNQITRVINKAEAELKKSDPDSIIAQASLDTIQQLEQNMSQLDGEVMNELLLEVGVTEETIEAETSSTDDYIEKISIIKVKLNTFLVPKDDKHSIEASRMSSVSEYSAASTRRKSYKLPKIELVKFSGDVRDWLAWWAQFNKIHEDGELHVSDKFVYLKQSMVARTEAESLVNKYQQTEENYPKVIEALKERFGEPKLLRKVHVRDLLQLVINNATCRSKKLSELLDRLEASLSAIEAIEPCKDPTEFLYPIIESSLPRDILVLWQHSPLYEKGDDSKDTPQSELRCLLKFLKSEVKAAQHRSLAESGMDDMRGQGKAKSCGDNSKPWRKFKNEISTAASLATTDADSCIFCGKNHQSHDCLKAQDMTLEQKKQVVKETRACYYCLKRNHSCKSCRSYVRCLLCKKKHHAIMCSKSSPNAEAQKLTEEIGKLNLDESSTSTPQKTTVTQGTAHNAVSNMAGVLLKTLYVRVLGPNGKNQVVRMLIDEGSQHSYIKTAVAEKLMLNVIRSTEFKNVCLGGYISKLKKRNVYQVQLQSMDRTITHTVELINDHVIAASPTVPDGPWMQELAHLGINITDDKEVSNEVHILIGSDLRNSIMTRRHHDLKSGLVAEETIFGWTLSGRSELPPYQRNTNCVTTLIALVGQEASLPQMWSLEAIGIQDPAEQITVHERELLVKEEFQNTIVRSEDGRYSVQLPWICEKQFLPSNKIIAEKRLIKATKRLEEQGHYKIYDEIFKQWEEEGIIERVTTDNLDNGHYLPHRPVFKVESQTTPVRPVFDASCKGGRGPSLNDCLEKGPNMLELIPSILFRFREKAVGGIADIRKAFQMIEIGKEDRNYQKFLWWENEKKNLIEYRHCRVVFGINCSPFILAAVVEYHLLNTKREDMVIAEDLLKSLYVDNAVFSVNTCDEYKTFKERATGIMAEAKMVLRQWETNKEASVEDRYTLVLGLQWDKFEDELFCQVPKEQFDLENLKVTKRTVLSIVSQVFDPMGIVSPALIVPKMLLQGSWAASMDWDTEWSPNESERFRKWLSELECLLRVRVPRLIFGSPEARIQLHCFSDASHGAYASVIFSRVMEKDKYYIRFVASKTRLAPLDKTKTKRVTIPRLELMSCLIGVRLTNSLKTALGKVNIETYYWSDSTTALAWIHRNQDWGTFVGNRVREIRNLTEKREWLHVPGHLNPADLPSRGCSPKKLVESKWWEGPTWLENETRWPSILPDYDDELINVELRKTKVTAAMAAETKFQEPRFSSFLKNVRVAAWIRRFINNCKLCSKQREKKSYLILQEVKNGEIDIMRQIQKNHYPSEPNIVGLNVKRGEGGLFRVRSRLTYKEDHYNFKYPVLLPRKDILVQQLIQYVHRAHGHAGTQFTLNKLRENYWIIQGRKTVGNIIRKCTVCRRFSSKSYDVAPAPLPLSRVQTQAMFETTDVDLAGPIILKGGKKAWIVIYTCAVYRGVYLDWVDSLRTQEFLTSLEKFTCLIGRPSQIYSDNGTNFVGAQNLMNQLEWKKLEPHLEVKQLRWKFNPPTASWWGGWWERLIKSIKELLRKMLGTARLTTKGLTSCLATISYVLNNRPLTTLTEDPEDLRPLTPAMFMRDLPISGLPEFNLITAQDLQQGYQKIQDLKEALKKRFRSEYLSLLIQRKNEQKGTIPNIGDIVLVGSDQKKRVEWPLGRIIELLPGKDSKIRVARVQTSTGILIRPLQRLYPMETNSTQVSVPDGTERLHDESEESSQTLTEDTETELQVKTRKGRTIKKPIRLDL